MKFRIHLAKNSLFDGAVSYILSANWHDICLCSTFILFASAVFWRTLYKSMIYGIKFYNFSGYSQGVRRLSLWVFPKFSALTHEWINFSSGTSFSRSLRYNRLEVTAESYCSQLKKGQHHFFDLVLKLSFGTNWSNNSTPPIRSL